MIPLPRFAIILVALALCGSANALHADPIHQPARVPHVRTTDRWMRSLLDDALRNSPTIRTLVNRLEDSDVVVYLQADDLAVRLDGRLTFVTATGGLRYVVVRVGPARSRVRQISILGHELQHAIEIAEAPDVVDEQSLAQEYARIGFVNHFTSTPGVAFDTAAALARGAQVRRELESSASD